MSLAEGIKVTGIIYVCAAFFYGYMLLVNLDKENAAIFFIVLLPRVIMFVHTMRKDTKESRKSFFLTNVVCTALWIITFVVKVICSVVETNPSFTWGWFDSISALLFFILQLYFAALSRSYWMDFQMHTAHDAYTE